MRLLAPLFSLVSCLSLASCLAVCMRVASSAGTVPCTSRLAIGRVLLYLLPMLLATQYHASLDSLSLKPNHYGMSSQSHPLAIVVSSISSLLWSTLSLSLSAPQCPLCLCLRLRSSVAAISELTAIISFPPYHANTEDCSQVDEYVVLHVCRLMVVSSANTRSGYIRR